MPGALFWFAPIATQSHAKPQPKGWGLCFVGVRLYHFFIGLVGLVVIEPEPVVLCVLATHVSVPFFALSQDAMSANVQFISAPVPFRQNLPVPADMRCHNANVLLLRISPRIQAGPVHSSTRRPDYQER